MTSAPSFPGDQDPAPLIREATPEDLPFIVQLEKSCFSPGRQSSKKSLRHSIASNFQLFFIIEKREGKTTVPAGAAYLFLYKRTLRIYSLAVLREHRMLGFGAALMQHIFDFSSRHGYEKITLEADAANGRLIDWYRSFGFEVLRTLPDYYGPGEAAVRMVHKPARGAKVAERIVIVVDQDDLGAVGVPDVPVCTTTEYLSDTNFSRSNRFQVLNLAGSYKTHSIGYYVSLLASARNHRVLPSVMTMKDVANPVIIQSLLDEIREPIRDALKGVRTETVDLTVVLGRTERSLFAELGRRLFALLSIPFFTITLKKGDAWKFHKIKVLQLSQVASQVPELLDRALVEFCRKKRSNRQRLKNFKYDLAILVNPNEKTPPSCPEALEKFRKAAEQVGFYVEFITKNDHRRISEFDALFIRETTAIENHTYAMARHAYTEGLVVIDDPWSILFCANKVYLYERLANAGICQPRGWLLIKKGCTDAFLKTLPLPLVLKLPESSFSQGVFKVTTFEELKGRLHKLFAKGDLVIAQEFLVSDYDWRIGMLDNTPLYACKYYMARGHWQIYNWQSGDPEALSGASEGVPLDQVPPVVLKAATKASALIGNGLYGVDLKEVNGKAYVIEINDNPSIDAGIEDELLDQELYQRVMLSIYNRIEAERHQTRYLY